MITRESIDRVLGNTAYDKGHNKIGRIGHIYVDERTGEPEWMTVHTGKFGGRETFVPLGPAELQENEIQVPFQKDQVTNAPNVDADSAGYLSEQDEARVYEHYGMAHPTIPAGTAPPERRGDDAMTRSEEVLRVGMETRETGRVHLRKYVDTEEQRQTVPLRRETVHLEREPITDQNREQALSGPDISEADFEVVTHEERPVVAKETVPTERVRLAKDDTTTEQTVGDQVRRERIELEGLDEGQTR